VDKPLESVMHGQCDIKPAVTFPVVAVGRHHRLAGTNLYCLVTERHMGVNKLSKVVTQAAKETKSRPSSRKSNVLTTTIPRHVMAYSYNCRSEKKTLLNNVTIGI